MSNEWRTRQTLLQRARNKEDHLAWKEFVDYYQNFILMITCKMNLSASEQEDLVQDVLLKLWKNLAVYSSEKASFRTWLGTVVRNTILSSYRAQSRRRATEEKALAEKEFLNILQSGSAPEVESLIDDEWKAYITNMALDNMSKIFSGKAVEAFKMTLAETPVNEICQKLELKQNSIYVLRNRVKSRFIEEVRHLSKELQF
ncbi:MAG: sigma-70 family RNA polymerase sigma factor [Lentisphaeraceae bacterium]|nr:sigma-70 family RNA polymerase sigma factor [Lentisphaeraceae bacterium]